MERDVMPVDSVPAAPGQSPVLAQSPAAIQSPAADEFPVTDKLPATDEPLVVNERSATEASPAADQSPVADESPAPIVPTRIDAPSQDSASSQTAAPSQDSASSQTAAPSQLDGPSEDHAVQEGPTPQDQLLFDLIKSDCKLHLGLSITYGACVATAVVFFVAIIIMNKGFVALLYDALMGASFASMAALWWSSYKEEVAALAEIGDDPTGLDTCRTYSKATAGVISSSRKTKKELMQLWIAYGILAIVMLFFGVFLFALFVFDDFTSESVLVISGAVLLGGGIILLSLAIKAFCQWIFAIKLKN